MDLSSLSPSDAGIAMQSWSRRFRAALAPLDDDRVEELAHRIGPEGASAIELATDTVRTWAILERALHEIRFTDRPVLHPAVSDASARHWSVPATDPLETVLDQLTDSAQSFADAIAATPAEDWSRAASTAGGGEVTALDVVREGVRVGTDNLRGIERTLAAVS